MNKRENEKLRADIAAGFRQLGIAIAGQVKRLETLPARLPTNTRTQASLDALTHMLLAVAELDKLLSGYSNNLKQELLSMLAESGQKTFPLDDFGTFGKKNTTVTTLIDKQAPDAEAGVAKLEEQYQRKFPEASLRRTAIDWSAVAAAAKDLGLSAAALKKLNIKQTEVSRPSFRKSKGGEA